MSAESGKQQKSESNPLRRPQPTQRTQNLKDRSWPGARRRSFFLIALVLPFAWHYLLGAASPVLVKEFGKVLMGRILPAATLAPLGFLTWFLMKRLMNLGMSLWWSLAVFAPFLNLWLGYRCFACPAGYAYQKKLDAPGVLMAILYWGLILAAISLFAACIALNSGAIHSPALQEQIRTVIRVATRAFN